jgi:pyrroloquinoline-quinone synthase
MTSVATFDSLIADMSLLKHPFYQKWSKGELTKKDLQIYAKEYFHLVDRIPGIVERVRVRADERNHPLAGMIEKNRIEEQEHVTLWKRFAKSLGISERELAMHKPSPTVTAAVMKLEQLADGTFEDGVVTMYSLEAELPKIAKTKKEGLCDWYNLSSEDAQIYFDEHLKEEAHLQVWRGVEIDAVRLKNTARASLQAQNQVLDGVCELCGIMAC